MECVKRNLTWTTGARADTRWPRRATDDVEARAKRASPGARPSEDGRHGASDMTYSVWRETSQARKGQSRESGLWMRKLGKLKNPPWHGWTLLPRAGSA